MPRQILRQADAISETRSAPRKLFCLALAVLLITCFHPYVPGAHAATAQTKHVFRLQYRDTGFYLNSPVNLESMEVIFKKEPDFGRRKIVRGALQIGQAESDFIGFAWDEAQCELYLDLNQNLDITDDPDGVYECDPGKYYQNFKRICIERDYGGVTVPYVIDLRIDRGSSPRVFVRSGWEGEIELNGKRWAAAVADNMDGNIDSSDRLILNIHKDEAGVSEAMLNTGDLSVPQRLSIDGHSYEPAFAFEPGETRTELVATFTESAVPMGELKIAGQSIKWLLLEQDGSDGSPLVVLDEPNDSVAVPVGEYYRQRIYLDSRGPRGLFRAYRYDTVHVAANRPVQLNVGGPVKHELTVRRWGNTLHLNYLLAGLGGENYTVRWLNPQEQVQFAVYKADTKIASGAFEYG